MYMWVQGLHILQGDKCERLSPNISLRVCVTLTMNYTYLYVVGEVYKIATSTFQIDKYKPFSNNT